MGLDGGLGLIAQFSKCDFWNLGDLFKFRQKKDAKSQIIELVTEGVLETF